MVMKPEERLRGGRLIRSCQSLCRVIPYALLFCQTGRTLMTSLKVKERQPFGEIIARSAPLVDVLWARELGKAPTDTPERRAAFEAQLYKEIARIENNAVKTHYEKEVRSRLWELWKAGNSKNRKTSGRSSFGAYQGRPGQGGPRQGSAWRSRKTVGKWQQDPLPASDQLRQSPMVRSSKNAMKAREFLVLEAMIVHPWILEDYSEEISQLSFGQKDLGSFRDVILQAQIYFSGQNGLDTESLRVHLKESGFGDILERVDDARFGIDKWVRDPDMPRARITVSWQQMLDM